MLPDPSRRPSPGGCQSSPPWATVHLDLPSLREYRVSLHDTSCNCLQPLAPSWFAPTVAARLVRDGAGPPNTALRRSTPGVRAPSARIVHGRFRDGSETKRIGRVSNGRVCVAKASESVMPGAEKSSKNAFHGVRDPREVHGAADSSNRHA